jgi:adenylate cyclase
MGALTEREMQRRLAAILAADVAGYSRLMGADEEGTLARLKAARSFVDPTITANRGRIVKTTGDGLLVEFASAVDAIRCAVAFQRGMEERNADVPVDLRIDFRIGIHVGDIIFDTGDIFGDGVNIAARLESIAEPGGICVSDDAQRQVRGKVDTIFQDIGLRVLKNIAQPMRVWGVGAAVTGAPGKLRPAERPALSLPDKPSIAILPFQNMSGDPQQEYFADGVVEDIITALSRFTAFFVIARNSSFTYKGKAVDIRQVGRDLGVRYVLEGSIRKSSNRIRMTGQLIEAETGRHVWADRFDGDLADVFDLQDNLTESVVTALEPRMLAAEIERMRRKRTDSLDAYDYYLRATSEMNSAPKGDLIEALRLYHKSIEMDPQFASPYGLAAFSFLLRKNFGGLNSIGKAEIAEAERLARLAGKFGQHDAVALSHAGLALGYVVLDPEHGLELTDRAILINKNLAAAWRCSGWINIYLGRPDTAITHAERAIRLSPVDPYISGMLGIVGFGHFLAGRYGPAIEWAQRTVSNNTNHLTGWRVLAASHAMSGNLTEARHALDQLRSFDPNLSLTDVKQLVPLRQKDHQDRYVEGLRLAGLPE